MSRRHLFVPDCYRAVPEADYWLRVHRRAMACRFEVTLGGEDAAHVDAAREALDEVERIEAQLTVFRETSELTRVNRCAAGGRVTVDADLFELLTLCRRLYQDADRAFDITSTPLSRCWGFLRRDGRLPREEDLAAALGCVGMHRVRLNVDARTVVFDSPGVELNAGAIGKGWALDAIARGLRRRGVAHALLSAGRSSVLALGCRSEAWPIDLTSPRVSKPIGRVHLRVGSLGTSGAGEQFFEAGGKRYGHVIDPRTGWPAESRIASVSVLAASAAVSDALSTAFLVGGLDLARRYCATHPSVMAIVTPDDGSSGVEVVGSFPGATVDVS